MKFILLPLTLVIGLIWNLVFRPIKATFQVISNNWQQPQVFNGLVKGRNLLWELVSRLQDATEKAKAASAEKTPEKPAQDVSGATPQPTPDTGTQDELFTVDGLATNPNLTAVKL